MFRFRSTIAVFIAGLFVALSAAPDDAEAKRFRVRKGIAQLNSFISQAASSPRDDLILVKRLKLDNWESKDGEKRSRLRVVAENFQFIGMRDEAGGTRAGAGAGAVADSHGMQQGGAKGGDEPPDDFDVRDGVF